MTERQFAARRLVILSRQPFSFVSKQYYC